VGKRHLFLVLHFPARPPQELLTGRKVHCGEQQEEESHCSAVSTIPLPQTGPPGAEREIGTIDVKAAPALAVDEGVTRTPDEAGINVLDEEAVFDAVCEAFAAIAEPEAETEAFPTVEAETEAFSTPEEETEATAPEAETEAFPTVEAETETFATVEAETETFATVELEAEGRAAPDAEGEAPADRLPLPEPEREIDPEVEPLEEPLLEVEIEFEIEMEMDGEGSEQYLKTRLLPRSETNSEPRNVAS